MGSYPHAKTEYKKLHLTKDNLSLYQPSASGVTSYQSDDRSSAVELVYTFKTTTTLMGFSKAKLWLSCDDTDDMDIYLSLRKVSKSGRVLDHINIPWSAIPRNDSTHDDVVSTNVIKVSYLFSL